ncbi:MAG TPA: Mut7-C RNAse domain-containing protein [Lysobacter sp.]
MVSERPASRFLIHGRLARFLAPRRRGGAFVHAFDGTPALRDPLEALGVPHTEVGRILVDGLPARLSRRLCGGEHVEVFPIELQSLGVPPRFVLDVHLGRLAGYLRLLGFDTAYRNDAHDEDLFDEALQRGRMLLTRDVGLLKRGRLRHGAFVYSTEPVAQLVETLERFGLHDGLAPFTRCVHCNGRVDPIDPDLAPDIPPRVRLRGGPFSRCRGCGQLYWRGTHEARLRERLLRAGLCI